MRATCYGVGSDCNRKDKYTEHGGTLVVVDLQRGRKLGADWGGSASETGHVRGFCALLCVWVEDTSTSEVRATTINTAQLP